jgi:Na+-driven multidrug efflux pump
MEKVSKGMNVNSEMNYSTKYILTEKHCIQLEENESLLELDHSLRSKEQFNIKENYANDDAEDSLIRDIFKSDKSIVYNILILAVEIAIIIYSTHIREMSVVYLCRSYGIEVTEAIASLTILFDLFSLTIPFAFTQGYSFKASEAYANRDYKYLGRLANKTSFILLILSLISISMIFGAVLPIIGLFLKK